MTTNFFDVLGVRASMGRTFAKTDGGGPFMMLLGCWRPARRAAAANPAELIRAE